MSTLESGAPGYPKGKTYEREYPRIAERRVVVARDAKGEHGPREKESFAQARAINKMLTDRLTSYVGLSMHGSTMLGYARHTWWPFSRSDTDITVFWDRSAKREGKKLADLIHNVELQSGGWKHFFRGKKEVHIPFTHNLSFLCTDATGVVSGTDQYTKAVKALGALCETAVGPRIPEYRALAGIWIRSLPPNEQAQFITEMVQCMVEKEKMRLPHIARRMPASGLKNKSRQELFEKNRAHLWRNRIMSMLKLTP